MDKIFVVSDTHFGHKHILKFSPGRVDTMVRIDPSITEVVLRFKHECTPDVLEYLTHLHDEMLIEQWNSTVTDNDYIFHLGDLLFSNASYLYGRLNGKKYLIKGNHDKKGNESYEKIGFTVIDSPTIVVGDTLYRSVPKKDIFNACIIKDGVLFSHMPIVNNDPYDNRFEESTRELRNLFKKHKCHTNMHGHIHFKYTNDLRCVNCSIEHLHEFRPTSIHFNKN